MMTQRMLEELQKIKLANLSARKTIIITGSTGFLGRVILNKLSKLDFNLVLICRPGKKYYSDRSNILYLQYNDELNLLRNLKVDYFLHLATVYGRNEISKKIIDHVNIDLPLEILTKIKQNNDFLFITCDTFYSKFKVKNSCPYTLSKLELINNIFAHFDATSTVNIRIEHMYGEEDRNEKFIPYVMENLLKNSDIQLTRCEQKRDFIHVDDVGNYFLKMITNRKIVPNGITTVELGTGRLTSLRFFVEELKRQANSSSQIKFGAINYESDLIWSSCAKKSFMNEVWTPQYDISSGIHRVLKFVKN
jgi:nucleoside-diphosphate-sugar epimerase